MPDPDSQPARRPWLLWLPVAVLGLVLGFAAWKLSQPADTAVRSALIGNRCRCWTCPQRCRTAPRWLPRKVKARAS